MMYGVELESGAFRGGFSSESDAHEWATHMGYKGFVVRPYFP